MAIGPFITKGLGSFATVPDFILKGFAPATVVSLTGGETGYAYATPTAVDPSLIATPPSAAPSLVATVPSSAPSLVTVPPSADPSLVATPPSGDPTYTYGPS